MHARRILGREAPMRFLVPALLACLGFAAALTVPTANACHPDPVIGDVAQPKDYYVIPGVWYGGCPHELTFCVQVWEETNGEPGLQRTGSNPDHAVLVVCPFP